MARNDYLCPGCGISHRDLITRATDPRPRCPVCGGALEWLPPTRLRMSTFKPVKVDFGSRGCLEFTSLSEVRAFEEETQRQAADGVGQPIILREFSQDRSNRDVNVFGEQDQTIPTVRGKRVVPQPITAEDAEKLAATAWKG